VQGLGCEGYRWFVLALRSGGGGGGGRGEGGGGRGNN